VTGVVVLVIAMYVLVCASALGLAGFWLLALKRAGSAWSSNVRLWVRLNIAGNVLFVLFLTAAAFGAPEWSLLAMAVAFAALLVVRYRIKRRAADWPPRWIERS